MVISDIIAVVGARISVQIRENCIMKINNKNSSILNGCTLSGAWDSAGCKNKVSQGPDSIQLIISYKSGRDGIILS